MYLIALSMIFSTLLITANITAVKIIEFGPGGIDAGIVAYPLTFLISDVISEIYGKKTATKIIWLGFLTTILMTSVIYIAGQIPPASFWKDQSSYDTILGAVPRIVIASMIAYLISQHHDVFAFDMWKKYTNGKYLWLRNNASTIISQAMDTIIFVTIAFIGVYNNSELWDMIWMTYIIKLGVAIIDTPLLYLIIWKIKQNKI